MYYYYSHSIDEKDEGQGSRITTNSRSPSHCLDLNPSNLALDSVLTMSKASYALSLL